MAGFKPAARKWPLDYPNKLRRQSRIAGQTTMSSKENKTNIDDARDAVKKQLLRSLMQQVVEEFSSTTDSDLSDLVSSMVSELNMDSMRERLSAMVRTEVRDKLKETDLDSVLKEQFSQTASTIEEEIKQELQDKLVERSTGVADALAEAVNRRMREVVSSQIGDVDDLVQEAVHNIVQENVQELSNGDAWTASIEAIHSGVAQEIQGHVEKTTKESIEQIADSVSANMRTEIEGRMDEIDQSVKEKATDIVSDRVEELTSGEYWSQSIEKIESELSRKVQNHIEQATTKSAYHITYSIDALMSEELDAKLVDIDQTLKEKADDLAANHIDDLTTGEGWTQSVEKMESDISRKVESRMEQAATRSAENISDTIDARMSEKIEGKLVGIDQVLRDKATDLATHRIDELTTGEEWTQSVEKMESDISRKVESRMEQAATRSAENISDTIDARMSEKIEGKLVGIDQVLRDKATDLATHRIDELTTGEEWTQSVEKMEDEVSDVVKTRVKQAATRSAEKIAGSIEARMSEELEGKLDEIDQVLKEKATGHVSSRIDELTTGEEWTQSIEKMECEITEVVETRVKQATTRSVGKIADSIGARMRVEIKGKFNEIDQAVKDKATDLVDNRINDLTTGEEWTQSIDKMESGISNEVEAQIEKAAAQSAEKIADSIGARMRVEIKGKFNEIDQAVKDKATDLVVNRINDLTTGEEWTQSIDEMESGIANEVEARIENAAAQSAEKIADSIDARMTEEIEGKLDEIDQALKDNATDLVADRVNDLTNGDDWTESVKNTESAIRDEVFEALEAEVISTDAFRKEISDRIETLILADEDLREASLESAMAAASDSLAKDLTGRLSGSDTIVRDAVQSLQEESDLFDAAVSRVQDQIIEQIANRSLTQLQDVERIATEARDHIAFDNDSLIASISLLRNSLIKDVARRAVTSMSDVDAVLDEAREWIDEEDTNILTAVAHVVRHIDDIVATLSRQHVSDTKTVVGKVLPLFTIETPAIKAAVQATDRILTERIADYTIQDLTNSDQIVASAAKRIPADHDAFQSAVRATISLLTDDIVGETENRMKSAEKISSDARRRMDDVPAEVRQAANVLENVLLSEVSSLTKERLCDVQCSSEKAITFLHASKEMDAIEADVRERVHKQVAEQAVRKLADTKMAASQALDSVDKNHENIQNAIGKLKSQLIFGVAKETLARMNDPEAIAQESHKLIPDTSVHLTGATSRLYELLVSDIARQSVSMLGKTDKAVEDASVYIDREDEVIGRIKTIMYDRMIEGLLARAYSEITDQVADTSKSAERDFFRNAVQSAQNAKVVSESVRDSNSGGLSDGPADAVQPEKDLQERSEPIVRSENVSGQEIEPTYPKEAITRKTSTWKPLSSVTASGSESSDVSSKSNTWKVTEFRPTDRSPQSRTSLSNEISGRNPKLKNRSQSKSSIYVYGVVRTESAEESTFFGVKGIGKDSTIQLLSCGGLTAIVSRLEDKAFTADAISSSMKNSAWLKEHVRQHADILAEAKGVMTIIPFRFGCVYSNPTDVKTFIDKHEEALSEALLRLKDRSEFAVRVGCDVSILEAHMEKDDAEFENSLNGISAGVANFLKSEISKDANSSDALIANISARIHGELQKSASEAVRSGAQNNLAADTGNSILNATYLVPISGELQFKMQTSKIAAEFEAFGIQIEVSGPWPPYHFIDIDLDGNVAIEGMPV